MQRSELNALIVRNIGDLEAAFERIESDIDPFLNNESWKTLKSALEKAEYFFEDSKKSDERWFAPRSWLDADEDSDPWFKLWVCDSGVFYSSIASYIAPKSNRDAIGIQWRCDCLYLRDYKRILIDHAKDLEKIEQAGFHRDGIDIYFPISFDADKLAEGFKEGNFSEALSPIAKAAEALELAMPAFQRLRDAIVAKAEG